MAKRYFEYKDAKSKKFWEVSVSAKKVTIRYGKLGTDGQTSVKELGTPAEAKAHAEKQAAGKVKKGYKEAVKKVVKKKVVKKKTAKKKTTKKEEKVMTIQYNHYVDYNHASDASTITWTHEEKKIDDCEPFIDFIRCDENGEEYQFLYSDEGDFVSKIDNFGAIKGNEDDEFILCYTADFCISNLDKKKKFVKALKYSDDEVEVVLGFKDKAGVILEDCFEENSNRTTKLCKIEE